MNVPNIPASSESKGRARWPWIAAGIGLLSVSALTIFNSLQLSRLTEQSRAIAHDAHVKALATRLDKLEEQAEAVKRQPMTVTQAELNVARQALDERLAIVEQSHTADDRTSEVQTLQARVDVIEDRLKRTAQAAPLAPKRATEPPKPKVPEPPFNILGRELRGGERFLSFTLHGAASLREVGLLREGDTLGAWHLETIEAHAAVFRVDGHMLRIAIP